ncbi:MAG TPA: hypothetical protein DCE71_04010 [Parachlamydiales bacterium]|nr:hypothetical protein [Parachlamydiales bacterium]
MRRILPFLLFSTAAITATTIDHRLDVLEAQMEDLRMQSVYGNFGANTASGYPYLESSWGLYFQGEAIYWKFFEGGTDYVYENNPSSDPNVKVDRLHYLDLDWRFAYRFTLGYQFDDPDLDLWSTFTRFTTDQSNSVDQPKGPNGALYPNQAVTANTDYTKATAEGTFQFNVLDVNVGRNYFLRKTFSMHPFMGVRGAKIDVRNYYTWEGSAVSDFHYKTSNDFWGIGLIGGTQGRWHFDSHWSFFGSFLGSLLYGWYDVGTDIQQFRGTPSNPLNLDSDIRHIMPNIAMDTGISWEYMAFRDRTRFSVSLAYEFQYWWAYNETLHTKQNATYAWDRLGEDFGLQGLKFNFGLDF